MSNPKEQRQTDSIFFRAFFRFIKSQAKKNAPILIDSNLLQNSSDINIQTAKFNEVESFLISLEKDGYLTIENASKNQNGYFEFLVTPTKKLLRDKRASWTKQISHSIWPTWPWTFLGFSAKCASNISRRPSSRTT